MTARCAGVLAGLGNPGPLYANTRHNVGFMVVDEVVRNAGGESWNLKPDCLVARFALANNFFFAVKPLTFMNLSGSCVMPFLREQEMSPGQMLVVHDDKDLAFGRLQLRFGGGAGGHKGVRSIIEALGEDDFYRLRIGIGAPADGMATTDYVLEPLHDAALSDLLAVVKRAAAAVNTFYLDSPERAMNLFNTRDQTPMNLERGISS